MNAGSRVDHNQFCVDDRWDLVRDARGREVKHHVTWELPLLDGRILRSRISRPLKKERYGPNLWKSILRDQLEVTEDEFWVCVKDGVRPNRGHDVEAPPDALPAQLVYQLIHQAGVAEREVADMTLQQAMDAMTTYWSTPKDQ
ncbi:MAG: cytotoxic translational repressor of toxin-antitoxin stability system [Humibacillus sp.]|nr:cytotoxic translational repressor of toxin-antitoxin stability system [Humibacillus sp.]MDN5779890.1 cytotoxic translational repressor of toxin-antitoxin stability system [Humibacillus sp.]